MPIGKSRFGFFTSSAADDTTPSILDIDMTPGMLAKARATDESFMQAVLDGVFTVPGDGFIDYAAFFRGLLAGGFDGVAAYEMCSPVRGGGDIDNLDRCASRYLAWMRENARGPRTTG